MEKSLEDKIAEWLAGEGYPLEMRVAGLLRRSDLWVRQAAHYRDLESGKSREIDVVATHSDHLGMAEFHFVIECKASKRPWVLLSSAATLENFNVLFALGLGSDKARGALREGLEAADPEGGLRWLWESFGRVGYNLQEALTGGNKDNAYAAAVAAIKASLFLLEHKSTGEFVPPLRLAFPAIVIGAPLFECFLDDAGDLSVRKIDRGWLFFDAQLPGFKGTCIRVISEDGLADYGAEVHSNAENLKNLLAPAIRQEWRTFEDEQELKRAEAAYPKD